MSCLEATPVLGTAFRGLGDTAHGASSRSQPERARRKVPGTVGTGLMPGPAEQCSCCPGPAQHVQKLGPRLGTRGSPAMSALRWLGWGPGRGRDGPRAHSGGSARPPRPSGPRKGGGSLRVQVPNGVRPESSPFQPDVRAGQRPPGWVVGRGPEGAGDAAGRGWARRVWAVAGRAVSAPLGTGLWSRPGTCAACVRTVTEVPSGSVHPGGADRCCGPVLFPCVRRSSEVCTLLRRSKGTLPSVGPDCWLVWVAGGRGPSCS